MELLCVWRLWKHTEMESLNMPLPISSHASSSAVCPAISKSSTNIPNEFRATQSFILTKWFWRCYLTVDGQNKTFQVWLKMWFSTHSAEGLELLKTATGYDQVVLQSAAEGRGHTRWLITLQTVSFYHLCAERECQYFVLILGSSKDKIYFPSILKLRSDFTVSKVTGQIAAAHTRKHWNTASGKCLGLFLTDTWLHMKSLNNLSVNKRCKYLECVNVYEQTEWMEVWGNEDASAYERTAPPCFSVNKSLYVLYCCQNSLQLTATEHKQACVCFPGTAPALIPHTHTHTCKIWNPWNSLARPSQIHVLENYTY